ncbi:dihydrofolate reductase [Sphingobacterium allocomposti]|jgi:dihydrofolate reductase|uniref:Dihydrofolate reductase n=1 Tax=Sphingobacterium allocomposti TaxID=415956 RepID=A0A5S5D8J2_9SPHI|nr:dihydrofolate reductase family protein [Sphingobacterium composti Yoo et al. 2007 non Ten et al. 2007]TYP92413.1 dihydrofolate reductase [Sphingobacterium composti Yoo et al. 2007 non Ten et al. 2007]HLS95969.1 dihydrofolate reductase family protein [Sphingobacterium sp.]
MRKLSLFIATSLDGFIAKPGDDLNFLNLVHKEGEDYGYAAFVNSVDTLIIGRKTYDYVVRELGPAHYDNGERDVFVVTRTARPRQGRVQFFNGDLRELVQGLKEQDGGTIYCDGGAEVINELLKHDLVDEFIISIVPILLGEGVRLFQEGRPEQLQQFVSATTFETGLVQLHYKRNGQG